MFSKVRLYVHTLVLYPFSIVKIPIFCSFRRKLKLFCVCCCSKGLWPYLVVGLLLVNIVLKHKNISRIFNNFFLNKYAKYFFWLVYSRDRVGEALIFTVCNIRFNSPHNKTFPRIYEFRCVWKLFTVHHGDGTFDIMLHSTWHVTFGRNSLYSYGT